MLHHKESQTARILKAFKKHDTLTNVWLNRHIGYRYGARIFDLRKEGHTIVSNHIKDSLWTFTLKGETK